LNGSGNGILMIDGVPAILNDYVLVDQEASGYGGIFKVTAVGSLSTSWQLVPVTSPATAVGNTIVVTNGLRGQGAYTVVSVFSDGMAGFSTSPATAQFFAYLYNSASGAQQPTNADQSSALLAVTDRGEMLSWTGVLDLAANSVLSLGFYANVAGTSISVSNASIAIQKI
jgi:hypothetical protein